MFTRQIAPTRKRLTILILGEVIGLTKIIFRIEYPDLWYRLCRVISRFMPSSTTAIIIRDDVSLLTPLRDPYWLRLVARRYDYEPELRSLLDVIGHQPFQFVDGGANIGYWSLLVSSSIYSCQRVIAIEPVPDTFGILWANVRHNRRTNIICINKALSNDSAKPLVLNIPNTSSGAQSASIRHHFMQSPIDYNHRTIVVESVSLDDICSSYLDHDLLTIVKLDIEGYELPVIQAATRCLHSAHIFIFEDHGSSKMSPVATFFLREGWDIFALSPLGLKRMRDSLDISHVKSSSARGYNFLAMPRSAECYELIRAVCQD